VAAMTSLDTHHTDTGGSLNREWARLRTRPDHLATARTWQLVDHPIASLDDILHAVGFERPFDRSNERRLRRLVALAADDELAARIVIQRLLPGLLGVVRRRRGCSPYVFDELLGAAWIAVRTYNTGRSPRCIAASLISDADYNAFRAKDRRRSSLELPVDPQLQVRPDVREASSCEQLAVLLAEAVEAGMPAGDLELVRQLLATPTAKELALALRITPRTIRNRRDRITSRLREVALAA
jgi:hypothetical protein